MKHKKGETEKNIIEKYQTKMANRNTGKRNNGGDFPGGVVVKNLPAGASLVAQWLRICLPMQGTRVRALVWEDPTCHGATGPMSHNY